MHLAFLTSLVSSGPPESGYEIANRTIIDGFRRAGHQITEIGYTWQGADVSDPDNTVCLGAVHLTTDRATTGQKLRWLTKAIQTGTPFSSAKLIRVGSDAFNKALAIACGRSGPIDGMILNGVTLAGAYEKTLTKEPYLFIAHNVEHVSAAQNADDATGLVERLMYRREARLLRALEQRLCAGALHILTLSEDDRQGLNVMQDARSTTLALVTPETIDATPDHRATGFDVGMIGSWTWTPNRIGLEWFLQKVVPHLPEDISIAIAGIAPRGFAQRQQRVQFLGRVVDAKAFCRQNRVMALTSRVGTGVQLKTIEAFEMGLPCVATRSSLRGIANVPDNVVVADNADAFAARLAEAVMMHRAGRLPDADGHAFRKAQIRQMDAAIAKVAACFGANS